MREYSMTQSERKNFCLCSVFQAVLRRHHIELTQDEIASNLVSCAEGFEMRNQKTRGFFRKNGLLYEPWRYNETPFDEPELLVEEIFVGKDVILGYNQHANLVIDKISSEVILLDPNGPFTKTEDIDRIIRNMYQNKEGVIATISEL